MKLIQPSVQILPQSPGIEGVYQQIERVGRTCYKSEDKITPTSAQPFVEKMIQAKHYAMLEHGTVYLTLHREGSYFPGYELINFYISNPYSKVEFSDDHDTSYITTNLRVITENHREDDLKYLTNPTPQHPKRLTLKFNTNIGVSREANRHRTFSIAEQSTRYCNYSKDKFGNEITYIIPQWFKMQDEQELNEAIGGILGGVTMAEGYKDLAAFTSALHYAEFCYFDLLTQGYKPQQAREVLPLATATEVVYTAFLDDWKHFFDLRLRGTTGAPHPNMLQIATLAHNLIKEQLDITL